MEEQVRRGSERLWDRENGGRGVERCQVKERDRTKEREAAGEGDDDDVTRVKQRCLQIQMWTQSCERSRKTPRAPRCRIVSVGQMLQLHYSLDSFIICAQVSVCLVTNIQKVSESPCGVRRQLLDLHLTFIVS